MASHATRRDERGGTPVRGQIFELVFVLLKAIHFELETRVSVDECSSLILVLWRGPFDAAPNRALVKPGAEETRRLGFEYRAFEGYRPFHLRVDEAGYSTKGGYIAFSICRPLTKIGAAAINRLVKIGFFGEGRAAERDQSKEDRTLEMPPLSERRIDKVGRSEELHVDEGGQAEVRAAKVGGVVELSAAKTSAPGEICAVKI